MALSADPAARRYTYADLETFPDDHLRREIIDGELIVTPSPVIRHQIASANLHYRLMTHAEQAGGLALAAPMDVFLSSDNVVEPDLLFIRPDRLESVGEKSVQVVPDLVVEISSPSTRRLELVRKRDLYQRFGVPEYWYVDLEAERVEIYLLEEGAYAAPEIRYPGQALESTQLAGFAMPAQEALGIEPAP
ncbi:MAG: Uma2 family endonuclease [Actinomycetota bacterium]